MVKLNEWSMVSDTRDPFLAPELQPRCLKGVVTGHHRKPDGEWVRTSAVVKAEGRVVTTRSGTVYELGDVDPRYREYVERDLGRVFDEENPIAVIRAAS